jgi:hypothetical protein
MLGKFNAAKACTPYRQVAALLFTFSLGGFSRQHHAL